MSREMLITNLIFLSLLAHCVTPSPDCEGHELIHFSPADRDEWPYLCSLLSRAQLLGSCPLGHPAGHSLGD